MTEKLEAVDPAFYADVRAESAWDSLTLWILPLAAVLHFIGNTHWVAIGLLGGGMFLYFAGRGIAQRLHMQAKGIRVGPKKQVWVFVTALSIWGLCGGCMVALSMFATVTKG
ncbi:hypothetical protein OAU50_03495 [Planctomycetota bacterium]|nr:hypothetical protein [Planctomycetota bacterium]